MTNKVKAPELGLKREILGWLMAARSGLFVRGLGMTTKKICFSALGKSPRNYVCMYYIHLAVHVYTIVYRK